MEGWDGGSDLIVMDNYTLINRVSMMEYRYDKVRRVLDELEEAVARYEDAKEEIKVLEEYIPYVNPCRSRRFCISRELK